MSTKKTKDLPLAIDAKVLSQMIEHAFTEGTREELTMPHGSDEDVVEGVDWSCSLDDKHLQVGRFSFDGEE